MRLGNVGVVIGKFNPPHLGHLYLIEKGAAQVGTLFVLLCDRDGQSIGVDQRRSWLEDAVPENVTVVVTPDDLPAANEPWARRTLEVLPASPDVAFTSEEWGPGWAELMGARHVMIDSGRLSFPISGTDLRADLRRHFEWLVPAARAELARRVVLVGAESTGKSTLSRALAGALGTVWVPEHGRSYWEGRRFLADQSWTTGEFHRIAAAQRRLEDDLARSACRGVVIADTDALVTAVWHERYLGVADRELDRLVANGSRDLYLVCSPDFDWVQDGTRESKAHRQAMHESILRRVRTSGAGVAVLSGPHDARVVEALSLIDTLTNYPVLI
ncbi:MAG: AAA family ATPase [Actinomycetia bacterium]|nr:AAA family ATPase [Actinomycetes bacterium]MCP4958177.1 AAA family ATPase [Actinomycetes bacterium]